MTTGIFIGRFQPFHKGHFYKILNLYKNSSRVVIVLVYYERKGVEHLSSKNPIPLAYRVKYIDEILSSYFSSNKYLIHPLRVSKNLIRDFINRLREIGDREYVIVTNDISRYFIFYVLKALLVSSFRVNVIYDNGRVISSSKIRKAIREGKYNSIRRFLLRDLDNRIIKYICKFSDKEKDLDYILRIIF